jgi:ribosome-associated toxin RatA of RatAB toxin-antitoxin module
MNRPLLLTVLACSLATSAAAEERKVVANRADCAISVGDKDAEARVLVIADCVWPIAPAKVIAAVKAVDKHDEYLSSVAESNVLPDGRVLQIHQASGISDRQITLQFTNTDLPDGGFKTSWTRAATQEPLRDGVVDAPLDDGAWEVHPDGANSKVTYSLRYDAGGKVPNWLVQSFQKSGIADIVEQMRAAAAK